MSAQVDISDVARSIVEAAEGDEQVEAFVGSGRSTTVKAYRGEVESLTSAQTHGVGVRIIDDGRLGFASCGTLDRDAVRQAVEEARDNARLAEPDEHVRMATPDGVPVISQDLWDDETVAMATEAKVAMVIELERATLAKDPRVTSVRSAIFGDSVGEMVIQSTAGIDVRSSGTSCYLSVSALANEGGETQIAGGVDASVGPGGLDLDHVADDASKRATRLLGATQAESQTVAMVLEPRLTATLAGLVAGMLTGDTVAKGRSPFADRLGEQIASSLLTILDDPTDPDSLGADEYDGEGLACRSTTLIDGGRLHAFLHNTESASRLSTRSTASAVRGWSSTPGVGALALAVRPGEGTHEELIAGVDRGVLVQSMNGLHSGVNPISGDFSVGVEGLMIRDGALAEPVREVTVASTIQRLLLDVSHVGADVERLPGGSTAVTTVIPGVALAGR